MKHVAIIGAGIIGASSAYHLARAGCRVTVFEADSVGGVASRASFGWLNASFHLDDAHFRLRHAAMDAHRQLAVDVPGYHHWPGCLWFEEQGAPADAFRGRLVGLGYQARAVAADEIGQHWPRLKGVEGAVFLPEEGMIDTPALAGALLTHSGAEVRTGVAVTRLAEKGGQICGLWVGDDLILADDIVIAAGTGSSALLSDVGVNLPLLRRPGAMVVTQPTVPLMPTLLCGPMGEVRQLRDGRLLMPTSPNHQGDNAEILAANPDQLARESLTRLAEFLDCGSLQVETVLEANRPVPSDGFPVLGRVLPGLIVAVMHSGATLAALAGLAVTDLVQSNSVDALWQGYGVTRFKE
ncbi:NAD(P)/FAD-dependent oxidoreductase [Thioclava sp. FR2]|uniref:NAD(P)/FAD-dependent oxidoreductase n=1 Tax=Thioclava sp. FR2 TaxID=3445780 RepID=UPI003EB802EA